MIDRVYPLDFEDDDALAHRRMAVAEHGLLFTTAELDSAPAIAQLVTTEGAAAPLLIPYDRIRRVTYQTKSDSTCNIEYDDAAGAGQSVHPELETYETNRDFGQWLGERLGYRRTATQENKVKALLIRAAWLIGVLAVTYFLTTLVENEDLESAGSSRRTRRKAAIVRLVVNTLGETGLWIIGGLIAAAIAYGMYTRFTEPSETVVYER